MGAKSKNPIEKFFLFIAVAMMFSATARFYALGLHVSIDHTNHRSLSLFNLESCHPDASNIIKTFQQEDDSTPQKDLNHSPHHTHCCSSLNLALHPLHSNISISTPSAIILAQFIIKVFVSSDYFPSQLRPPIV